MNDLERWGQPSTSIIVSREERGHTKKMDAIVFEAQETALQIDADAAVTSRIMDRAASLDAHRVALAKGSARPRPERVPHARTDLRPDPVVL